MLNPKARMPWIAYKNQQHTTVWLKSNLQLHKELDITGFYRYLNINLRCKNAGQEHNRIR